MIIPQSKLAPETSVDISNVRGQIDAIDAQLAALIVHRCGLSASVASAKRAVGDSAFGWRPAREVEILRTLMREQASLDPQLAFSIWRALISANLAAQGDLTIFATADTQSQALAAFNVGSAANILTDTTEILTAIVNDDHAIGVLPWPSTNDWWVLMMDTRFSSLHVCAASPLVGEGPQVLLIAARPPEEAGEDISLIAGPIGAMEGGIIAQSQGLALVACGEFISPNAALPAGCRLIGTFAVA
jgi:chorismate mutase